MKGPADKYIGSHSIKAKAHNPRNPAPRCPSVVTQTKTQTATVTNPSTTHVLTIDDTPAVITVPVFEPPMTKIVTADNPVEATFYKNLYTYASTVTRTVTTPGKTETITPPGSTVTQAPITTPNT